jgi:hypothetical protein
MNSSVSSNTLEWISGSADSNGSMKREGTHSPGGAWNEVSVVNGAFFIYAFPMHLLVCYKIGNISVLQK